MVLSVLFLLLLIGLAAVRFVVIRHHSWKLPTEKHILFMGASHINRGVDDTITEEAVNWASPSERYMYTYIKLKHLIDENPQVDTVFLQCSATDLWQDADYKYHDNVEQSKFIKLYWPLLDYENVKIFRNEPRQCIEKILTNLLDVKTVFRSTWWQMMGGYEPLSSIIDIDSHKPSPEPLRYCGNSVNYYYLRAISDLCKSNSVKLILMQCPVLNLDYYYDMEYFYGNLKEEFGDIEFVDYSDLDIPFEYRYDAHHLNKNGAVYFTEKLKQQYNIR